MVLKQNLSASKMTTSQETSKKAEHNPPLTSLPGFSAGYKSRNNAQMAEHRAYVRNYLAEERQKKPVLPSNKNTCPSKSSNATRTSLNGFSKGYVGSEFEIKRKNYIKDHFTDYQKYSKQYNPKFLVHVSHESPSPLEKKHGTSATRIYSQDEASYNSETVNSEKNKPKKNASKHTTKVKSLTENQILHETSSADSLNSKRNAMNSSETKITKPFYDVRPVESSRKLPPIKSNCGEETEYSSSFGNCSINKNSISNVQKDMLKHKEDYLDRTQTESGYGFAKINYSPSKQESTAGMHRATMEYHENRAKNNKTDCPFPNDGKHAWHRDDFGAKNERVASTGINEYNRGTLEKKYKNKNFVFG